MPTPIPSRIDARLGEEVRVELESVPGAGYEWEVDSAAGEVELVRREVQPSARIGGAAREVLVLVPRKVGNSRVTLRLKRAWETECVREADIEFDVADGGAG